MSDLKEVLSLAEVLIGYSPLDDEADFGDFLKEQGIVKPGVSVLADRTIDPKAFAGSLAEKFQGKKVSVFIPGREFDALGTRHGRGGGWYDRFLSNVPREWVRIGVLKEDQFSSTPLKREVWDEPMDWLLVTEGNSWNSRKI